MESKKNKKQDVDAQALLAGKRTCAFSEPFDFYQVNNGSAGAERSLITQPQQGRHSRQQVIFSETRDEN